MLQHPPNERGGGEDTGRVTMYPTKGRRMVRREIEFVFQGAEGRLIDIDAETNGPMAAASRKQVDLKPEPPPAPKVPTTPAAAAVEPENDNEDQPPWWEL